MTANTDRNVRIIKHSSKTSYVYVTASYITPHSSNYSSNYFARYSGGEVL